MKLKDKGTGTIRNVAATNIMLPDGKTDVVSFDQELIGFGVRTRRLRDGRIARNFIVQYRAHGRQPRLVVGDVAKLSETEARKRAKADLAKVELGHDPAADKRDRRAKDSKSLRFVISHPEDDGDAGGFLENRNGVKATTVRKLRQYLIGPVGKRAKKLGVKPYLGPLHGTPIDRITRADISSRVLAVSKSSGLQAAIQFRGALNSFFAWAVQMGFVENNPTINSWLPTKPVSRDRVLSNDELALIWNALEDDEYGKIIKLLICTGCRREEIGGMRRTEFAPDMATWTLPKERSKTGRALALPITPLMAEVLDAVYQRDGIDHLFGGRGFTGWSQGKRKLDDLGLKPWQLRDLRRSVDTHMNEIGVAPHIVERVLNHKIPGVAAVYNHARYAAEVRDAMLRWDTHVKAITTGEPSKVVALDRKSA